MHRLAALSLTLLAAPALATEPLMPPHVVAETFCLARLVGDMSLIKGYYSPRLYAAIGTALLQNAEWEKAHPGEKPPLGDGIHYASFPDTPSECVVDYEGAKTRPDRIAIRYSLPNAPALDWTDKLLLVEVDGVWQLDDVVYSSDTTLTEELKAYFEP
jgi:hypothetical protein